MSLYDLATETLDGEPAALSEHAGKVALVVNVASKCGFTPQYEALQQLQADFGSRGFVVLGFPSNDFGEQEPGAPAEIAEFCRTTYGVTFPMFAKRMVSGPAMDEIYRYLTRDHQPPDWNFTKYLVDRDGTVTARFEPGTPPDELRRPILALLDG